MKMQQQSMNLAGINLDLTSSTALSAAVKSESTSNSDSIHQPHGSTLSTEDVSTFQIVTSLIVGTRRHFLCK